MSERASLLFHFPSTRLASELKCLVVYQIADSLNTLGETRSLINSELARGSQARTWHG